MKKKGNWNLKQNKGKNQKKKIKEKENKVKLSPLFTILTHLFLLLFRKLFISGTEIRALLTLYLLNNFQTLLLLLSPPIHPSNWYRILLQRTILTRVSSYRLIYVVNLQMLAVLIKEMFKSSWMTFIQRKQSCLLLVLLLVIMTIKILSFNSYLISCLLLLPINSLLLVLLAILLNLNF